MPLVAAHQLKHCIKSTASAAELNHRLERAALVQDLGNARSPPSLELTPTFTTLNRRICLLLATGEMGRLRIEDAERLQVPAPSPPQPGSLLFIIIIIK